MEIRQESSWAPMQKNEGDSDLIERQSLTFWQDSWRRFKQNKVAIISMCLILLVLLASIVVPIFWPMTYSYQRLEFSNTPPLLKIYPIGSDWIYITDEFKVLLTSENGELLGTPQVLNDDKFNRKYVYEVAGKELVIDYSTYFNAKKEYLALEQQKMKSVRVEDVTYLLNFYGENSKEFTLSMRECEEVLEKHIPRYQAFYGGSPLKASPVKVWNKTFIWGSDSLGRDLFIRVVYGARTSLLVGFAAAVINFFIGVFYGGIAGYIGGRTDNIMMRIVDIISSIPMMLYVILLMIVLEPGLKSIIFAMSITYWVGMARIVRGQVLSLREQEFVMAIKVLGGSSFRILSRHLIPNMMGPIMVSLSMQIPSAMFTEAFLSFTGMGVAAPQASWGTLCNDALQGLKTYPYQMFFPALTMSLTILAFNLFSDGLRDALDPKLRK